ncbi:MAG: hypothetical protein JWM95_1953 [Gemmatimonadetes bacterium]|nr:hypothetical protein [Gemmatimonadota bacterium]
MRKYLVIALAVASIGSAPTFANAQSATTETAPVRSRIAHARGDRRGLFNGLALSADEKARIKDVHSKYRADNTKLRQSTMAAMQQARAARQKGDTAAARSILEGTKANRDAMRAQMLRERDEIRTSLSAENQKQFDANAKRVVERHKGFVKNRRKAASGTNG